MRPTERDGVRESPRARRARGLAIVALLGAAGGFVLGSLILGLLQQRAPGGWSWVDVPFSMMFGGTFGALVGAVAAPVLGLFLFRHVPLGRAMLVTAAGTLAGAAIGLAVAGAPIIGSCAGFVVAAVLLRFWRTA